MKPALKISALALAWTAAVTAFFWWFHRLLGLSPSLEALALAALVGAWVFSAVALFRGKALRAAVLLAVTSGLTWSLASFAYFRVFGSFLPFDAARVNSLSLPAIKLIAGYYDLVPLPLAAAAGVLVAAALAVGLIVDRAAAGRLAPNRRGLLPTPPSGKRTAARLAAGILLQILFFFAVSTTADAIRERLAQGNIAPEEMPTRLGLVGYAFASGRAQAQVPDENTSADAASLPSAKTNVDVVEETLSAMATGVSLASRPPLPAAKHVIVYQMESAAAWPLDQQPSPMPFLASRLAAEGSVGSYFASGCTTIDAEFAVNCGFLPESYGPVSDLYAGNDYRCLPSLLAERGFATSLYHAGDARFWARDRLVPAWGFQKTTFSPELVERAPDTVTFDGVVADLKAATGPTYQYVIGFTGHSPHNEHFRDWYNRAYGLGIEPYAGPLGETSLSMKTDEATLRLYLGFLKAADDGLAELYARLATEGLLDDTVIVAFGDHRFYEAGSGDAVRAFLDYNRLPFLLHAPGLGQARLAEVASHVDVAPTVYDLVTGGVGALPETFLGRSLLSPGHRDAAVTKCLGRASYYDGQALVTGDLTLGAFQALGVGGELTPARSEELRGGLKQVTLLTDLMLKRNELGEAATRDTAVEGRLRTSDVTDSDGDGLSDMREQSIGTDSRNADSDGDGYPDGDEAERGYNPLGPGRWVRE